MKSYIFIHLTHTCNSLANECENVVNVECENVTINISDLDVTRPTIFKQGYSFFLLLNLTFISIRFLKS